MADISVFQEKSILPGEKELAEILGITYPLWEKIKEMVMDEYPQGKAEWNYPGKKYGWSFRIQDNKRAIIYLLPRSRYFKVAFVFGQKATDIILESDISSSIKQDLESAKNHVEGRGIRIDVKNDHILSDIRKLILIKLAN